MILHDPKAVHRVQPDERQPVAYLLRTPTVVDRVQFRHAVRAQGAKQWSELQMLAGIEEGVKRVLSEPDDQHQRDELLAEVRAYRERITTFATDVRSGQIDDSDPVEFLKTVAEQMAPPPLLKAIERVVVDHYPPYAAMVADRDVYQEVAGLVAARMFLVGWEGLEADFRRTRQGVPDDVLANIPSHHLVVIGAHAERLMEPTPEKLRHLPSGSGQASGPDRSNGTATQPPSDPSPTTGGSAPSSGSPS